MGTGKVVLSDGGDADRAGRDEDGVLGDEGHGEQRGNLMPRLIWLFGRAVFYLADFGHHNIMDIYDLLRTAAMNETSALLESQGDREKQQTPLPKGQLALLCAVRLMDPLTFTQASPSGSVDPRCSHALADISVYQSVPHLAQSRP